MKYAVVIDNVGVLRPHILQRLREMGIPEEQILTNRFGHSDLVGGLNVYHEQEGDECSVLYVVQEPVHASSAFVIYIAEILCVGHLQAETTAYLFPEGEPRRSSTLAELRRIFGEVDDNWSPAPKVFDDIDSACTWLKDSIKNQ